MGATLRQAGMALPGPQHVPEALPATACNAAALLCALKGGWLPAMPAPCRVLGRLCVPQCAPGTLARCVLASPASASGERLPLHQPPNSCHTNRDTHTHTAPGHTGRQHTRAQVTGERLSDTARRAIYPELLKRLDDSNNGVRVAACRALVAFVSGAGGAAYCNTNSGYLAAGVIIHMDDSDARVQDAACSVLEAQAAHKPAVVAAEVNKVRLQGFKGGSLPQGPADDDEAYGWAAISGTG